jgi:hypothetical protein
VRGLDEEWHLHSKPFIHWKAITSINAVKRMLEIVKMMDKRVDMTHYRK